MANHVDKTGANATRTTAPHRSLSPAASATDDRCEQSPRAKLWVSTFTAIQLLYSERAMLCAWVKCTLHSKPPPPTIQTSERTIAICTHQLSRMRSLPTNRREDAGVHSPSSLPRPERAH